MLPLEFPHRNFRIIEGSQGCQTRLWVKCYAFNEDRLRTFCKKTRSIHIVTGEAIWLDQRATKWRKIAAVGKGKVQRWSDFWFEGPAKDGFAVDWPIPIQGNWLSWVQGHVEKFLLEYLEIKGRLSHFARWRVFLPGLWAECVEKYFQGKAERALWKWPHMISSRCAHIHEMRNTMRSKGSCDVSKPKFMSASVVFFGGYFIFPIHSTIPLGFEIRETWP